VCGSGTHRLQLGQVLLGRELVGAADVEDLAAGALLPLRVHGEEHGGPGQEVGRGLLAGEEERLALLQHLRHGNRLRGRGTGLLPLPGIDHGAEQVAEAAGFVLVGRRLLGLVAAPGDEPGQAPPYLPVQLPRLPVLLGRQEPAGAHLSWSARDRVNGAREGERARTGSRGRGPCGMLRRRRP
jgi:hypothetical protein